jgi:hypothetical protein
MIRIGLLVFVLSLPVQAGEWGADAVLNFSQTEQALLFNGKSARYKLGGLGLLGKYQDERFGTFYLGGGMGYSPDETASFFSVTASGSATSIFKQVGYKNQLKFTNSLAVNFYLDHRDYDIEGDLEGKMNNQLLKVDADSRFKISELVLSTPIRVNQKNILEFGVGVIDWQIDATAKGRLEAGISAKTSVEGSGTEPLFIVGLQTELFDSEIKFTYKNSKFAADEKTTMHEIVISLPVAGF